MEIDFFIFRSRKLHQMVRRGGSKHERTHESMGKLTSSKLSPVVQKDRRFSIAFMWPLIVARGLTSEQETWKDREYGPEGRREKAAINEGKSTSKIQKAFFFVCLCVLLSALKRSEQNCLGLSKCIEV